jgi:hypothetical protein
MAGIILPIKRWLSCASRTPDRTEFVYILAAFFRAQKGTSKLLCDARYAIFALEFKQLCRSDPANIP